MIPVKIQTITDRVNRLIEIGCSDFDAAYAIRSHAENIEGLHKMIDVMSLDDALSATQDLYVRLEDILTSFEGLNLLRDRRVELLRENQADRSIRRFNRRLDRISQSIKRLPLAEEIAMTTALYEQLREAVDAFKARFAVRNNPTSHRLAVNRDEDRRRWN